MNYIEKIRVKITEIKHITVLNEDIVWQTHDTLIWQADKFEGMPSFYNVYRYGDYYSYSILALILLKNNIKLNQVAIDRINQIRFANHPANYTIDREIVKIGAPHQCCFDITDKDEYCALMADALIKDIAIIESKNSGKTNLVMCGGRDSMNLLLLPWKNLIVALSAEPNYPLVCDFVKNNNLNIEVRLLEDHQDDEVLQSEILEACCRANLMHWRWGVHLKKIADEYSHNAILWKGQLGDIYQTDSWKDFITPYVEPIRTIRRIYKKFSYLLPPFINRMIGHKYQAIVINRVWEICSSLQGGHMSFLRGIMDMLVLSAYHGPNVSNLIEKVDLGAVCQKDLRPKIGKILLGRDVIYPEINPHPITSEVRKDLHKPEKLCSALEKVNVKTIYPAKT